MIEFTLIEKYWFAYRSTIRFLDTSDDFCADHDRVSTRHRLKHKNSKIEVVDQWIACVSGWVAYCQCLIRRVATPIRHNYLCRIRFPIESLAIVNTMDHNLGQF